MLTIGKLAVESGTSRDALSYHEREGLLAPAAKTGAGYRLYAPKPSNYDISTLPRGGATLQLCSYNPMSPLSSIVGLPAKLKCRGVWVLACLC
ncbi:MerR family DNA-binding transcriptional regulator [Burkholderia sp. Bp9140]|uniref:MerR family DNA-binding transcriptional regulator n=1 Tax=Burkholderia sp. Bp9140 TaxID=2184572 RepID=UPI000F58811B|nr:MerR family DNA-binding transcriptional regulator [Burkholderia sp. Bp9140]RQR55735.1 MerR family DNA-binding transcriptional regulator [Burkholderia sp. Bp9140]